MKQTVEIMIAYLKSRRHPLTLDFQTTFKGPACWGGEALVEAILTAQQDPKAYSVHYFGVKACHIFMDHSHITIEPGEVSELAPVTSEVNQ